MRRRHRLDLGCCSSCRHHNHNRQHLQLDHPQRMPRRFRMCFANFGHIHRWRSTTRPGRNRSKCTQLCPSKQQVHHGIAPGSAALQVRRRPIAAPGNGSPPQRTTCSRKSGPDCSTSSNTKTPWRSRSTDEDTHILLASSDRQHLHLGSARNGSSLQLSSMSWPCAPQMPGHCFGLCWSTIWHVRPH